MKKGALVYDKADPRHQGVVMLVSTTGQKVYASVRWCESGFWSFRVDTHQLKRVRGQNDGLGNTR